jgi:hypothetical protein
MRRLFIISFLTAGLAALVPVAALAKGASEATIAGPGLGDPIMLAGEGQPGGDALMSIAVESGFFAAVFDQSPDPMLDQRPAGSPGPRYTVTYVMPGPNNEEDELVQDLYPYANPSPVTYVEPGQRFWSTEQTRGGWYVASSTLRDLLVSAGLPQDAPVSEPPSDSAWSVVGPVGIAVLIAALGGLAMLLIRRRPQTA